MAMSGGQGQQRDRSPGTGEAAALDYLRRGWSVVPVRPRTKRPMVSWTACQTRRPDARQIARWFERWPQANLAIVTGALSGLVVLDVDPAHGGQTSLLAIEREQGPGEPTLEALTGGGGRHLYFRHPGVPTPNRTGLRPGLDLRGDGGVVVVPPSIHPNGRAYRWREGHDPASLAPAPLPRWLRLMAAGAPAHLGHPPDHWRELVVRGVAQGSRNESIASLTGHLLWRGVDPEVVLEMLLCWNRVRCRPPLADDEVAATVASIERTHARHAVTPPAEAGR